MCEVLYETALRFAEPDPARPAVDLYCGIGSLSLPLARRARHVQAVEIQEEAIAAARENASLNGIANVDFHARDVRPLLKFPPHPTLDAERADDGERPAVVVVDPPRAGLARKALQRAAALGAERFVYVSCNPTTLAGNGAELAELGYRLRARGAGRHVPADAPHRDGRPLRARRLTPRRRETSGRARRRRSLRRSLRHSRSPLTARKATDSSGSAGSAVHHIASGDGDQERGDHGDGAPPHAQPEAPCRPEVEAEEDDVADPEARVRLARSE